MTERKKIPDGMRIEQWEHTRSGWTVAPGGMVTFVPVSMLNRIAQHILNGDPIDYELPKKKRRVVEFIVEESGGLARYQYAGDKIRWQTRTGSDWSYWASSPAVERAMAKTILEHCPGAPCVKEIDDDE